MKVGELVKLLQGYRQDEEVVVTWEGVLSGIEGSNIYLAANGNVIIDADGNCYKQRIQDGEYNYMP